MELESIYKKAALAALRVNHARVDNYAVLSLAADPVHRATVDAALHGKFIAFFSSLPESADLLLIISMMSTADIAHIIENVEKFKKNALDILNEKLVKNARQA